jgi:hypothetical protein
VSARRPASCDEVARSGSVLRACSRPGEKKSRLAPAIIVATALAGVPTIARGQDASPPADDYSSTPPPSEDPPPPPEEPPPSDGGERIDETGGPAADETIVDERRAAEPETVEQLCLSCVFIATGTVILIATIPLAAQLEAAVRRRDRLGVWYRGIQEEGGDPGFIAGYGVAKARADQLSYGIATGIVGGVGIITLGIGIGIVAYEGGFTKGPKEREANVDEPSVRVLPTASHEGAALFVDVTF